MAYANLRMNELAGLGTLGGQGYAGVSPPPSPGVGGPVLSGTALAAAVKPQSQRVGVRLDTSPSAGQPYRPDLAGGVGGNAVLNTAALNGMTNSQVGRTSQYIPLSGGRVLDTAEVAKAYQEWLARQPAEQRGAFNWGATPRDVIQRITGQAVPAAQSAPVGGYMGQAELGGLINQGAAGAVNAVARETGQQAPASPLLTNAQINRMSMAERQAHARAVDQAGIAASQAAGLDPYRNNPTAQQVDTTSTAAVAKQLGDLARSGQATPEALAQVAQNAQAGGLVGGNYLLALGAGLVPETMRPENQNWGRYIDTQNGGFLGTFGDMGSPATLVGNALNLGRPATAQEIQEAYRDPVVSAGLPRMVGTNEGLYGIPEPMAALEQARWDAAMGRAPDAQQKWLDYVYDPANVRAAAAAGLPDGYSSVDSWMQSHAQPYIGWDPLANPSGYINLLNTFGYTPSDQGERYATRSAYGLDDLIRIDQRTGEVTLDPTALIAQYNNLKAQGIDLAGPTGTAQWGSSTVPAGRIASVAEDFLARGVTGPMSLGFLDPSRYLSADQWNQHDAMNAGRDQWRQQVDDYYAGRMSLEDMAAFADKVAGVKAGTVNPYQDALDAMGPAESYTRTATAPRYTTPASEAIRAVQGIRALPDKASEHGSPRKTLDQAAQVLAIAQQQPQPKASTWQRFHVRP